MHIIGIGSSAGGLQALEEFLDNCPSDTGFAFVIIQHLSPDYKSLMPELLSRHTAMSVKEAKEGDEVKANHVYLIPGTKNIEIKKGKLVLIQRPPNNQINFSVDIFFKSLALEKKEKAISIILSGTGSDGTKGAKAIKEIGGAVFVQEPTSAAFDGMPRSAINQGLADFILAPRQIGAELVDFVHYPNYPLLVPSSSAEGNNESLSRILKIIKNHLDYDFFSYKRPTLLRRIAKRIGITKSTTVENYIDYLHDNPEEKYILTQEFLIGVTKFFRDSEAFEIIRNEVIPSIVRGKKKGGLKVWTVACSTGEEAYSLAILISEYLEKINKELDFKIFATDIDEKAIEIATKGIYNSHIETEIVPEILEKYFIKNDKKYQIQPSIRKKIIFSKHNILQNPPFNKMDLVSCRNMLIYLESGIQHKVLSSIHYSLNLDGFLFLGSSENLGLLDKNFQDISTKWKIYKNVQPERILDLSRDSAWRVDRNFDLGLSKRKSLSSIDEKITKTVNAVLMGSLDAVSVCIDTNFEIIQAVGKLKKYIQYPDEGYSNNLLKILPDELHIPIATSIRKLGGNSTETVEKRARYIADKDLKDLRILVTKFDMTALGGRYFLVTIIEEAARKITAKDQEIIKPVLFSNEEQLQELKEALSETRENLQATIEELETSNEEMQATNEELLSANEELQSTNEELQSLNEELHTVNAELQEKNTLLIELNSDIENLMNNITVGTIFLDKGFMIRRFTPAIKEHFQLRAEDIGRSISHFSGSLGGQDIIRHSKSVIETLQPYTAEIKNTQGRWFNLYIVPYRSQEDAIEGVVIKFVDINELKVSLQEGLKTNRFLTHLIASNPAIIYVYDILENKNIYSSASIEEIAGYTPEEVQKYGSQLMSKIIHPEDFSKILEHHKAMAEIYDNEERQIEYRIIHKNGQDVIWLVSSDKVNERTPDGKVKSILGVTQVITESKKMEVQLRESEERFRLAMDSTHSALWEWTDKNMHELWISDEGYKILGYKPNELDNTFKNIIELAHPEQRKELQEVIQNHIAEQGNPFEGEIQVQTKDRGYIWVRINGQLQREADIEEKVKVVGTLTDIDDRKTSEDTLKELNVELEQFAYLASHDLKEPLLTVTSFTRLFRKEYADQFDKTAFQYIDFIDGSISRMITLTDDLLRYSQLDRKSLKFQTVDLNKTLSEITDDLQNSIQENGATIKVDKLPKITCDASQIKQLFQNLISNGLKYHEEGANPNLWISSRKLPNGYEFSVKDNGIGIAPRHQKQIFEVFKRLHGQGEYEGSGIGLANCKRIVDNHQGDISVDSQAGEGATFYFTIPKL